MGGRGGGAGGRQPRPLGVCGRSQSAGRRRGVYIGGGRRRGEAGGRRRHHGVRTAGGQLRRWAGETAALRECGAGALPGGWAGVGVRQRPPGGAGAAVQVGAGSLARPLRGPSPGLRRWGVAAPSASGPGASAGAGCRARAGGAPVSGKKRRVTHGATRTRLFCPSPPCEAPR